MLSAWTGVGFSGLATARIWQPAAFLLAQRMLRKLKENIFPQIGRQVRAIVRDDNSVVAGQRQMAGPIVKIKRSLKWLEAADALAIQSDMEIALCEKAVIQFLNFQIVTKRLFDADDVVV